MENNKYEIIDNFCIWEDLLGYGTPFYKNDWDLNKEICQQNIARIKNVERALKTVPVPVVEKILFLNDGLIRNVDVYKEGTYIEVYLMWLEYSIEMFRKINNADKENGFPGIRGVLTAGNRTQYTNELTSLKDLVKSSSLADKENFIVYSPKEFQMNTAFSKAYIMEGEGSKQGLHGSNLYIDLYFINFFKDMVNNSSMQELTKVVAIDPDKKPIYKTYNVNYTCSFEKDVSDYEMKIFIDIGYEKILYRKITFSEEIIFNLKDKAQNTKIYTKLYKTKSLWSIENDKYFEMDT